jgi:hypothetical protein
MIPARKREANSIGPGRKAGFRKTRRGTTNKAIPKPTDACRRDPITIMRLPAIN